MKKQNKKEKEAVAGNQTKSNEFLTCQICGRKIELDACIWQEDDEGAVCCNYCAAEKDSCGCSD